ncbi:MAG: methyltransferase domain-containing protein [Pseudomonadota bacterium]
MSDRSERPRRIHDTEALGARLKEITERATVDMRFLHDDRSREHIRATLPSDAKVLDVGGSMRGALADFAGAVETLDINDIEDNHNLFRPDILGDVCSPFPDWMSGRYDAVIALAVIEHVYDPPAAVANFRLALRPGGTLFLYVPWIWRYHAPRSLVFQDYQRLSRDGMAYLLRDFEDVTLYPLRGKYSSIANLLKWWKPVVERRFGGRVNRMLDARASAWRNTIQASGFFAEARRP